VDWELRDAFTKFITPEKIVAAIRSLSVSALTKKPSDEDVRDAEVDQLDVRSFDDMEESALFLEDVRPEDIVVDFSTMHYGMKAQNPLERIKFYSKTRPDGELYQTRSSDVR
jgi:deoxynucleoside triphosphate triphosphohydrolase SAMHD1